MNIVKCDHTLHLFMNDGLVRVVTPPRDGEPFPFGDVFYENFSSDDWDYMFISQYESVVSTLGAIFFINRYEVQEVMLEDGPVWICVTYHA